jgi:hypothetical protein
MFADDEQLHNESATLGDIGSVRQRLSDCVCDARAACLARRLRMNAHKTYLAWFGTQYALNKVAGKELSNAVNSVIVHFTSSQPVQFVILAIC